MLEATIQVVRMCSAYAIVDNHSVSLLPFLKMQQYNPVDAAGARYSFTFDLGGKAFARVVGKSKKWPVDLADLYGTPWDDHKVVGFSGLWIAHPDWSDLSKKEVRFLVDQVESDLFFDYAQDELNVGYYEGMDDAYLYITVEDADDSEEVDE